MITCPYHPNVLPSNSHFNLLTGNCSCLVTEESEKSYFPNCTIKIIYNEANLFELRHLENTSALFNKYSTNLAKQRGNFTCIIDLRRSDTFTKDVLLNIHCKGDEIYEIIKSNLLTRDISRRRESELTTTTAPEGTKKGQDNKSDNPKSRLVIGLSVGLGAMVATVTTCWTWVRCRRKERRKNNNDQDEEFGYIDAEEDSAPYRIVDLQTNISSDASGYTFLKASEPNEETPYMKLLPKSERLQNKETTGKCPLLQGEKNYNLLPTSNQKILNNNKDIAAQKHKHQQNKFDEVKENDDDTPYDTLWPTTQNCKKTTDLPEIKEEPVYYVLEQT
ncbi:uncharacterized protein LOC124434816 [Xenia sp. Carnegie-2017]|uniref:uncharacterized protein LOC124434816 n=1 Tax=Xenia sp. Carnegie-2017 TaxID=2897299 RepID=UPI001F049BE4|nr:uncharacterized protein LOC124434816 [Xenia sp. Carnegie-2017]